MGDCFSTETEGRSVKSPRGLMFRYIASALYTLRSLFPAVRPRKEKR